MGPPTRKIRLILADPNRPVREGLSVSIRLQPDMELLAATFADPKIRAVV